MDGYEERREIVTKMPGGEEKQQKRKRAEILKRKNGKREEGSKDMSGRKRGKE